MLELRFIRENPDVVKKDLKRRGYEDWSARVDSLLGLDAEHRKLIGRSQELRAMRNNLAQEINELKKQGKDIAAKVQEAKRIPGEIKKIEETQNQTSEKISSMLYQIPNILHDSVPNGQTPDDNITVREVGKIPEFDFNPKSHVDFLDAGLADIERAGKISGARFYYLKKELVLMDFALQKLALDLLYKKNYTLVQPPYLMHRKPYEGVTDLKDFEDVMYKIEGEDLYLIATSEHPMAAMYMDEVLDESQLPIKLAGVSPCFRKEAGAHGKDTKGIFRVHQFNKVEQFIFCKPEDSWQLHEELLKNAEDIFKKLKLPYRVVNICTADIGTVAAKKYDIEVYYPVQKQYREACSISNCTSYQAARLNVKYRSAEGNRYVHTLNATAVATTRAMAAIIENYQNKDGSITIPTVLHKYMDGLKKIKP
ncbi:serine--tRNA ligase [Candidatus Woesearchaeota archaeon]|nr:serine--tRNA ligase [Candidatus Woesearchaeota archaeon]